jgi:16S rRNA (adenine1518-N6/adenine1519-N6)-dimethyltransferase
MVSDDRNNGESRPTALSTIDRWDRLCAYRRSADRRGANGPNSVVTPRRSRRKAPPLGQHFLRDMAIREAIVMAVPSDGLPILEVGPGQGALTEALATLERPLVAVELDRGLATLLRGRLREWDPQQDQRLSVLNEDILDVDPSEALASVGALPPYGLVGNLPYAITAPLLRKFLSVVDEPPSWMVIMVQREVAQQIVAPAGKRSLLSVSAQYYATTELLFTVEREAFRPPPKVRSAVVWLERRSEPAVDVPSEARFFEVVRAGFRAPRKQIHNSLSQGIWLPPEGARPWLEECGIDPVRRAATLTLEEWARLAWARERAGVPAPPEARDVVG